MLASNIHAYFARIELDPAIGWEMLETDLENPVADVVDVPHLRRLLASYASRYIDMAWDDEDREPESLSSMFTHYVRPLLKSTLPLTLDEQRLILGTAGWYGVAPGYSYSMFDQVRTLLNGHPILPPKDA